MGANSWPYDDDHQRKNWMLSLCARCLVCLVSQVCKLKHISPWFSFFLRKCITTNHIRKFTRFKGLRMVLCWWSLGATQDFQDFKLVDLRPTSCSSVPLHWSTSNVLLGLLHLHFDRFHLLTPDLKAIFIEHFLFFCYDFPNIRQRG